MKAIYEPKGAALEYAPLACNLFNGCTHGCRYCYVPGVLRTDRVGFHSGAWVRDGILAALDRDAALLAGRGDTRRVHLCFTCDPFGMGADHAITREALAILRQYKHPVAVLTKGVLSDTDIAAMQGMDCDVGVSLVWGRDSERRKWEPGAASVTDRADNLRRARDAGLRTWISVEPVIDPEEAFWAIWVGMAVADMIKVGRLNHMDTPRPVDWPRFARMVSDVLTPWAAEEPGRAFLLKRGLAEFVTPPASAGGEGGDGRE
ncbi:MAG: radical SAM protein [Lentisphaeria bacterium]